MRAASLRQLEMPRAASLAGSTEEWLAALGGPAVLRIPGRDRSRVRAVTTLLHGNEPSGVRALHGWLRRKPLPAVDVIAIVASVEAALVPPGFARRMLPGRRDLNRCFRGPFDDPEGARAAAILAALRAARPEALIDVHNNTGLNPAYAVAPQAGRSELALCALFSERFVHSTLDLGALVEVTTQWTPSVTIEVGRAGDPAADRIALAGLERYVDADDPLGARAGPVSVFRDPLRVSLRPGISLAFSDQPVAGVDLTIRSDVERHNFEPAPPGASIGWVAPGSGWPIVVLGADGGDRTPEHFALRDDQLALRAGSVPIMVTTNPEAARSDCLFYLVRPAAPDSAL